MKINDSKISTISVPLARTTKDIEKTSDEKINTESSAAPIGAKVATQAPTALSFDTKRVDEIKAAIANGTFKVNPEKVADGLLSSVKTMLGQKQ